MNDAPTRTKPQKHGLTRLLKADCRQLDGRSSLGQAMSAYRADLISSLGGKDNLSTQELCLVDMCARDRFVLEQIDAYLLTVGLFSKRKRSAFPLTLQRNTIADGLTRRLLALGLSRRSKPTKTLAELLSTPNVPASSPFQP